MKKNYIKPEINIIKMGTNDIICASLPNTKLKNATGKFIIGDDDVFEVRYDKNWTIQGDVEFDEGEISTR